MKSIQIIANASYLPKHKITNATLAKTLGVSENYILQRTGIQTRYIAQTETIEEMAIKAAENVLQKAKWNKNDINMIVVATTSTKQLMPGIAFEVQKALNIPHCQCLDILAGCAGYINAIEIARNSIAVGSIQTALVIGVDKLTNYINQQDTGTAIVLSDGAGATLVTATQTTKTYASYIQADGSQGDMLTCYTDKTIEMKGNKVYRYAVTQTIHNVQTLLEKAHTTIENIAYIVPHQSNQKIMNAIVQRLGISQEILFSHIEHVGNTFCASIPIALAEMENKKILQPNQTIVLLGYGGGANTASILLQI